MWETPIYRFNQEAGADRHEKGAAEQLIDDLSSRNIIRLEDKPELKRIWETRNRVVHPDRKRPRPEEVEVMIDCIERICRPWEESSKRFGGSTSFG